MGSNVGPAVGVRQSVPILFPVYISKPTIIVLFRFRTCCGITPQRSLFERSKYAVNFFSAPNCDGIAGSSKPFWSNWFAGDRSLCCRHRRLRMLLNFPSSVGSCRVSWFDERSRLRLSSVSRPSCEGMLPESLFDSIFIFASISVRPPSSVGRVLVRALSCTPKFRSRERRLPSSVGTLPYKLFDCSQYTCSRCRKLPISVGMVPHSEFLLRYKE